MKALVATICMTLAGTCFASASYDDNPAAPVSIPFNRKVMSIEFRFVDNPMQTCDRESKRVGNGGFAYQVKACAFWYETTCTIIAGKKTSQHTLGHEVLHCLKGDWHPQ